MIIFLQATRFVNTERDEWSCEICKHLVTKHAGNLREAFDSRAKRVHSAASFRDISIEFSRLFACFQAFTRICVYDTELAHPIASHLFSYSWRISISAQLRENFRANICRQLCGAYKDAWVVLGFRAANRGQGGVPNRAEPRRCIALHLQLMLRRDPDP